MHAYKLVVICPDKKEPPMEVGYIVADGKIADVYIAKNPNDNTTGVTRLLMNEKKNGWELGKRVEILLTPLSEKETKDLVSKLIR